MEKSSNQKIYTDILIIGGGVIGGASAYYLSKKGFKVTILEKSGIATGASGSCDGFLFLQSKKDRDIIALTKSSLKSFLNLSDELSYDIEYENCGGLVIFSGHYSREEVEAFYEGQKDLGINTRIMESDELHRAEPFISDSITSAAYCADEGQVNPIALNLGFCRAAKNNGARVMTHQAAVSFEISDSRNCATNLPLYAESNTAAADASNKVDSDNCKHIEGDKNICPDTRGSMKTGYSYDKSENNASDNSRINCSNSGSNNIDNGNNIGRINNQSNSICNINTDIAENRLKNTNNILQEIIKVTTSSGTEIFAGEVIICAGAWSGEVGKLLGINIPIRPRCGSLAVTEALPRTISHPILDYDYICCKFDENRETGFTIEQTKQGNLLIGSIREFKGFDNSIDSLKVAQILKRSVEIFGLLSEVSIIRIFSGFRPYSQDFKPIIGAVGGFSNLWIASGHEGDGIALSCATGKLITAMVESKILRQDFINTEFTGIDIERFLPSRFNF